MSTSAPPLTIAVVGATGTVGSGLLPRLEADERVGRVLAVGRRSIDPAERGWSKARFRTADVRDPAALRQAVDGAQVVVHLAFVTTGATSRRALHAINVEGTRNAFQAAAAVGAERFVFASSVAAYGFHPDNPVPLTETWPTRPSSAFFYAQEKAELDALLREQAETHDLDLYVVRPSFVLGRNPVGGKVRGRLGEALDRGVRSIGRSPLPVPVLAPDFPFQVVHQDDLGAALAACALGDGPPGAYNVAADDVLTGVDVARELGFTPLPVPAGVTQRVARITSQLPLPAPAEWVEAAAHPAIMDTSKAKAQLGWSPVHSARETLRETLGIAA